MKPEETHKITITKGSQKTSINTEKITSIEEDTAYWRKANQIHQWFVKNVQNGEDDCKEYNVCREKLEELQKLVTLVLFKRKLAPKLLPVQEGFFFGDTEYNSEYFEDLQYTKTVLEEILKEPDSMNVDYYYSSSW